MKLKQFLIKLLGGYTQQYTHSKDFKIQGYLTALLLEYGEITLKQPDPMITELWIKGKKITYASSSSTYPIYFGFQQLKKKMKGKYRITAKGHFFKYPKKEEDNE